MLFLFLIVISVLLYYLSVKFQRRNWPPGPFPYPLIGNAIEVYKADPDRPYAGFHELSKKYGDVYVIKIGVVDNLVINGHAKVKEGLIVEGMTDRFHDEWVLDRSYGSDQLGLFFSTTNAWKNNRRYTQRTLKDFGFGKLKSMDDLLLEEFQVLIERLKDTTKKNKGLLRLELTFNAAFVNIIYSFLTGTRFSQDDPELQKLVKMSNDWFVSSNVGGSALGAYPFLKNWAPELCGFGNNQRSNQKMLQFFMNVVQSYRAKGDYKHKPSNFVEETLKRIDEGAQHGDYDEPIFTDKNLVCLLNDLFAAGSETSANSTSFAVRRLVQNPVMQTKMQNLVDRVVGRDRFPTLVDKPLLPYVEAFSLEVLRTDSVAPLGPRRCHTTCKFGDYEIPAGLNVLVNNYSANMDKRVWGDPFAFRPERFLNDQGQICNTEKLSTFGYGKRNCIGERVARDTLYMALACFAQHFTFLTDPVAGPPGYETTKTITLAPQPFNTLVVIR